MAKKTSEKNTKKKKGKKSSFLSKVFTFVAIILFALWYVGGKPTVTIGDDGIYFYQTEEPIIAKVTTLWGGNIVLEEEPVTDFVPSETVLSTTGTTGSFSGDLGYKENDPLHLGNPSDAVNNTSSEKNYLMIKPQFTLSYNNEKLVPNWVAWHLDSDDMGDTDRKDDFRPDDELPEGWYGVKKADYQYSTYGFDRGHVCPSADRTKTEDDNSMTFLMTNMMPQSPDNNRVIWMHFENFERDLVEEGNELYIIAGPYGEGGTSGKGTFNSIEIKTKDGRNLSMNVPESTWKVVIAIPEGTSDISRIDKNIITVAINVPNAMGMGKTGDWEQFITSIDEIESLTGYDFFELLPDDIEDAIESRKYVYVE